MEQTTDLVNIAKMTTPEYRELLEKCVRCGKCLEVCPTYAIFGTEADGPRGRITLMRAVVQGRIDRATFLDAFADHITLCLECRACETACPSGVQYGKLIEGARITLEEARTPGPVERLVRWFGMNQLMPHVGQLKLMAKAMWLYEVTGLQWLVRTVNVLPKPLNVMEGILPPISPRSYDYSKPAPAMGEKRGDVAFFHGCIQEAFLAQVNAATVRVLQRNGYEVHFPQGQTCCGAAQWHTGDEPLARKLARQNIDAFMARDYLAIVNNAGGCGLTLEEYPDLLKDDPVYAEKAEAFAAKIKDFSEFVAENLREQPQGELRVRATYSDSCHLRHGQGVIQQPRDLLRAIPGLEFVDLKYPDRCCGSAGIYNIVQSETSSAVLDTKMEDIAATGAELVVTSNTGCHMQLVAGVRRAGLKAHVMHIAEVLDLAYQADTSRLEKEVRHPKPLFGYPELPERWLAWQAARYKGRDGHKILEPLKAQLQPGQVWDDLVTLLTYEFDSSILSGWPTGVVFPYTSADVETTVRWAMSNETPVIARGSGTGLAGGATAPRGGLVIEFSHMKDIVELDTVGRSAVVQSGTVNVTLDEAAKAQGLYFPPDPASGRSSTVVGNIATNAGGPHCFKYGVTTNYVTGLDVVLTDGRSVKLGGRALDYPEIDLVGLMTGSEGTLGVITQADVRLIRNPPAVKTLSAAFETIEQAGEAVSAVIARGLVPATMEMMDQQMTCIVEEFVCTGLTLDAGGVLIIDADGYPESVAPQIEEIEAVLREHGGYNLRVAQSAEERDNIWYARKSAAGSLARVAPDHYTVDGTVPRSRLAEALHETNRICADLDLDVVYLLHAGDGNMHPMILIYDINDEDLLRRVHESGRRVSELCVSLGGTITGEHGVGSEKRDFMTVMYNADELNVMREIKTLFDPNDLLNPDKVIPALEPLEDGGTQPAPIPSIPDGVTEFAPETTEEAADIIRGLTAAGKHIRVRGGGTKSTLFPAADVVLSTAGLRGIKTYTLDDVYVTVGAGTPLAEVQATLIQDGMWVPLVSPWPEATVGGIVASNFNAPLRTRYGGVRDLVLAVTVVLPDGRIVRAGRPVMKNVAGYDLTKLFVGSYGTLGLITDVTLKLASQPRARVSYAIPVDTLEHGATWGTALLQEMLIASSLLLCQSKGLPVSTDYALLYTAEGLPEDVKAELSQVRANLSRLGAPAPIEIAVSGSEVWAGWMGQEMGAETLLRVGVAPKDLPEMIVKDYRALLGRSSFAADLAGGQLFLRGDVDVAAVRGVAQRRDGYAVVLRASGMDDLDVWGHSPAALNLMRALKLRWDIPRMFNPDVFIV